MASLRTLNHTKIYSDGKKNFGTGTPVDGVERFCRNRIAVSASVRFHRPDSGIGLNDTAKVCIRAARKVESHVALWEVATAMDLLGDREAELAARPGAKYLLYFTDGGNVTLDLTGHPRAFDVLWIIVSTGEWCQRITLNGGSKISISVPGKSAWVAAIVHESQRPCQFMLPFLRLTGEISWFKYGGSILVEPLAVV